MDTNQLDLRLNSYFEDVLSSRKNSLEETKQIAFKLWNFICKKKESLSCKRIDIYHYNTGEIALVFDSQKVHSSDGHFPNYCDDPELLTLISLIAENSDVNGKFNSICNGDYRELKFQFK